MFELKFLQQTFMISHSNIQKLQFCTLLSDTIQNIVHVSSVKQDATHKNFNEFMASFFLFSLCSHFSGLIFTCKAFNISQQKTVFCSKYNKLYIVLYHNSCFLYSCSNRRKKLRNDYEKEKKFNLWRCLRTIYSSELSKEYLWEFFSYKARSRKKQYKIYLSVLYIHMCSKHNVYLYKFFSSHRHNRGKITNLCSIYFLIAVERSIKLLNKKICIQIYFQHVAKQLNYLFCRLCELYTDP